MNLLFVDCETTGLDPEVDSLLEVGLIVTSSDLTILHECNVVIDPGDDALNLMDPYVREMHTKNGLLVDIDHHGRHLSRAIGDLDEFLTGCDLVKGKSPMFGNTVGFDRSMLHARMPALLEWWHYRNVDVSSFKEVVKLWGTNAQHFVHNPDKPHRALGDLHESIRELRHYKDVFWPDTRNRKMASGW